MVYVPIPHNNDGKKAGPHETAIAFFSWLKWQGEGDAPSQDSDSGEEK